MLEVIQLEDQKGMDMKKLLLSATMVAAVAATGPAFAADIPVKAPRAPVVVPVAYSWSGCYIGGNGGGLWARKDYSITAPPIAVPAVGAFAGGVVPFGTIPLGSQDLSGWALGGQVGCNIQTGSWVFGIQGDYDWTNSSATTTGFLPGTPFGASETANIRGLGSVTGRVGYAWDRMLWYVKGGVAWERDNYNFVATFAGFPFLAATASDTRTGWTVGAGAEYAFTDYLTGFIEGDYYDFGTRTENFTVFPVPIGIPIDVKERKFVGKVGFNWKFNWWNQPVVSRY